MTLYSLITSLQGTFVYWLGSLSVFFTAYYSFRLLFLTFLNKTTGFRIILQNVHEGSLILLLPLLFLAFGSIFLGYFTKELFVGFGTDFWQNSMFIHPFNISMFEVEDISIYVKFMPLFLSILGILLAYLSNTFLKHFIIKIQLSFVGKKIIFFLNKKWFLDKFFNNFFVFPFARFGYFITLISLDRGLVEFLGPLGITKIIKKYANILIQLQSGQLVHYVFFIIIALVWLFCINVYPILILQELYLKEYLKLFVLFFFTLIFMFLI